MAAEIPLDLRIDHGTLVTARRSFRAALGCRDGRIAAIGAESALPPAQQVIDATGLLVMAGVIDPHVHMREPGHPEREDWHHGTRAAAAGGVTCVLEHPNSVPPVTNLQTLNYKRSIAESQAVVDFGLYGGIGYFDEPAGGRRPPALEDVEALAGAGVPAFKTFLWPYPDRRDEFDGLTALGEEEMRAVFALVARTGRVLNVHAEHKPAVDEATARLRELPRHDAMLHERSRPIEAEIMAVRGAIAVALETGVRLNFPHCSGGSVVEPIAAARASGHGRITAETCPHYLFLTDERLKSIGPYGKINPPLRSQAEQDRLWALLRAGMVETIGSDHAPHTREAKEKGWADIFAAPAGSPGVETTLPLMLTAVRAGRLSLQDVTRLCSENVARLYGLYPRKGALAVGADADLVLVDPLRRGRFEPARMHTKNRESARLYEGVEYAGAPVMTVVRGRVVMRDGEIIGEAGYGRFVRSTAL